MIWLADHRHHQPSIHPSFYTADNIISKRSGCLTERGHVAFRSLVSHAQVVVVVDTLVRQHEEKSLQMMLQSRCRTRPGDDARGGGGVDGSTLWSLLCR